MQKKIQKIFFDSGIYVKGANMLRNSLKNTDTTKTEFFEMISFQSDQKIWQK